ncbi:MAG TPA: c-type cytochrome [Chitinophagaceae bacterium]|jgi:cytochrome c
MAKTPVLVFICISFISLLFSAINPATPFKKDQTQQQDHAPVVKVISPANNSTFAPGAQVHYSVTVSDQEDGDSKYDEINQKEVLLEVKYLSDEPKLSAELSKAVQNDPPGLAAIRTSNCFNCHSFNSKGIGPSFSDINKKYKPVAADMALLGKRIHEGSSGIWGDVKMPSHPELSNEQIQSIVRWIMQNASAPGIDYYIGTEGSFPLPDKNGAFLLTASYTDHGTATDSTHRLKGQDVVVIRAK